MAEGKPLVWADLPKLESQVGRALNKSRFLVRDVVGPSFVFGSQGCAVGLIPSIATCLQPVCFDVELQAWWARIPIQMMSTEGVSPIEIHTQALLAAFSAFLSMGRWRQLSRLKTREMRLGLVREDREPFEGS